MSSFDPSRRSLLGGAACLSLLGLSGLGACVSNPSGKELVMSTWPLGMQLWTVNAELQADLAGTLKAVKAAGYESVETAGLHERSPADFKAAIEAAGLKVRAAHTNMGKLIDDLDGRIKDAVETGAEWLICSSPKPPTELDPALDWVDAMTAAMTPDAWKFNADKLAEIAPKVAAAGLKFGYHNHHMEFIKFGEESGFDLFLKAAGPELLRLELDLGWVAVAGLDPAELITKHADRVDLLHLKDMVKDGGKYRSTEIGRGVIDWKAALAAARTAGVKAIFVEQEAPYLKPALESLADSAAYLKALAA